MNPLRVALFSPVLFIPGIFLRFLPFKSVVKKEQKLKLALLYILALMLNGAVYFFWGKANGGLSMSFLKTDMIIFALVLTGVNMLVIKGKIKEHLFTYGLSMLLNYMNLTFSSFFSVLISPEKINKTVLSIGIYFVLYIILFPMFLKLLKITVTPFISIDSGDYWNTIWFVPIAMFLACYFTIFGENTVETLPQVIGRLFLLVSVVFLCRSVAKDHMRMTKQLQTEKQLSMQTEYYNELSEQVAKARKSRHDMKHHMAAIQRYIDSDDKEGLQEYCYDFTAEMNDTVIPYTGNPAADGVLYHYSKIAKENDIRFEMKGTIKSKCIADVDLCVLLGNALDNAVAGCLTAQSDRFISIIAESDEYTLTVVMQNSFDGVVEKQDDIIMSRKRSGRHGVGLDSMRSVCEKYGGTMETSHENNVFTGIFILPYKND